MATQCLLQRKPKSCQVCVEGALPPGVTAKDIILAIIHKTGVGGGAGYVFEYTGSAIRGLSMEERMTLCNMSIEGGARAGMVAPDDTTFEYLAGRPAVPQGQAWGTALRRWRGLATDEGATYDLVVGLDGSSLEPMITFGTNPGMGMPVNGRIPNVEQIQDTDQRAAFGKALNYMGLQPGQPLQGQPVDVVFIGSCTNGRLADLQLAASLIKGRKVAQGTRVLVVPGSQQVKRQAETLGLDRIFTAAGAEWREPGCSMCIAMNGDQLQPGQYAVSTSNRNFEGRQGKGGRTFLASPLTAAAAAVTGQISDPRRLATL
jgi:3-isopropylmalate/(R)-2-methylmalate dehydratase large subunit